MNVLSTHPSGKIETARPSAGKVRTLAIAAALVVNIVILTVARLTTGAFPAAHGIGGVQTVGVAMVVIGTLGGGLIGWGLLALLERRADRPAARWTAIALALLALSLLGTLGGVDTASRLTLACLHLAAGAIIIPLMRRSATVGA